MHTDEHKALQREIAKMMLRQVVIKVALFYGIRKLAQRALQK